MSAVHQESAIIVGGGPVGLTIAQRLVDAGWRVTVLESGASASRPIDQKLTVLEESGYEAAPHFGTRARALGGTATIWNTFADRKQPWARLVPMNASDFACDWPITFNDVEAYYGRAYEACGLDESALRHLEAVATQPIPLSDTLELRAELLVPSSRFTRELPAALIANRRASVVTDTTMIGLHTDAGGAWTVRAIDVVSRDGRRAEMAADVVILAAGGIENPRLLLQAGIGGGATGRYFCDHFTLPVATFTMTPELRDRLLFPTDITVRDGSYVTRKLQLRPEIREGHHLHNAALTVNPTRRPLRGPSLGDSVARVGRFAVGAAALAVAQRSGRPGVRGGHWSRVPFAGRIFDGFDVEAQIEQTPHPDNRVTLGSTNDCFGLRRVRVENSVHGEDLASFAALSRVITAAFTDAGAKVVDTAPLDPLALWSGMAHHLCSTRMHSDPERGVVDANCRVHGTTNLYCAGSSVFSSGGYANPTFTALALGLRLADHLVTGGCTS